MVCTELSDITDLALPGEEEGEDGEVAQQSHHTHRAQHGDLHTVGPGLGLGLGLFLQTK